MIWLPQIFSRKKPSLHSEICGREITGMFLGTEAARLRFSDGSAVSISLDTRRFLFHRANLFSEWISFPGWLRITGVNELPEEISLTVSGAIYSSRICFKEQGAHWQISFGSGQIF